MAERPRRIAIDVFGRKKRELWILRAVALVISVLLWITVLGGKRVEIEKRVVLDYRLPKNVLIANNVPKEVIYRVSGPRAFLKEIEERPITVAVDLVSQGLGEFEVSLREEQIELPIGLRVVSISQRNIPVRLDRAAIKRVPVRAVFESSLPNGTKVETVTFKPSLVELQGPQSRLQTVETIPTKPIPLTPTSLRQEFDIEVNLAEFPGVSVDENAKIVHAIVELSGPISRRSLEGIPVGLRMGSGSQARVVNPRELGIRVRPQTVTFWVEGPDVLMEKLPPEAIEVWAEIADLSPGGVRARLFWKAPPDLRVVRRSTDWVDVTIPSRR
mgnify:CR=1 FL=1